MARKRPEFSFPELEHRGRGAILRTAEEVEAEQAQLEAEHPTRSTDETDPQRSAAPASEIEPQHLSSTRTRTHARTQRSSGADVQSALVRELRRKLQVKQRLATYSLRFRPEELEELDRVLNELNQRAPIKLSKNDLGRLALNWLLSDYQQRGEESVLARVAAREDA